MIFLVGATGTGKSTVAMEIARKSNAAILAMDAMQVYRGADIGTRKPTAAERAEIPHGGLDLAEFGENFDVAQYLKHAGIFLREQREAGRQVIVTGGTGLYFRALTQGLCKAPQGSDELRVELNALPVEELRERLKKIDPAMLERLDSSNPRRLVRAIEVREETGRSLREWQEETPEPLLKEFTAVWIQREKAELEARIKARVEAMFSAGWVEEVRGLIERHGVEAVRHFPGIGYREIAEMLESQQTVAEPATATLESVKSDIFVATRQYAKRQLTWFNREPTLQAVMLSGTQPLPAALLSLS
ncbi:MAG TPA: tRNA (adenosine(37)-N6)-dimethylallyltransferase MiaA [Candidatus Methylacidiphilales bacterium]